MKCTRLGTDDVSGRELFVARCVAPADAADLELPECRFVCLLAWDAEAVSAAVAGGIARHLIAQGCVYICVWGPDCERVHDIFDEVDVEVHRESKAVVMSTWHHDEPLSDAIWFALNNAFPDEAYAEHCKAAVGLSIGNGAWASEIEEAFADPARFNARVLASE